LHTINLPVGYTTYYSIFKGAVYDGGSGWSGTTYNNTAFRPFSIGPTKNLTAFELWTFDWHPTIYWFTIGY